MRSVASVLLLAGLLSAAGQAHAQAVYAGATSRSEALTGAAAKVAASLGKATAGFGAVDLGAPATPDAPGPSRLEEIQRLLADARGRYLEGDFQEAVVQAAEAMKRFEERLAFTAAQDAWAAYAEVQLVRSLALRRLGKEREADDAFERLAALMPEYVPDPGLAPPKVASRYQAVLKGLQEKPKVALEVTSRPAGAEITVDGKQLGTAPAVFKDLLPGVHFVSVTLNGERFERRVVVLKGQEKLAADLGDPRSAAAKQLVATIAKPVDEASLGRLASSVADEAVVALVEPDRDALLVLAGRLKGGKLVAVTGQRVSSDLAGVDAAMAALAAAALTATADSFADGSSEGVAELRGRFLGPASAVAAGAPDEGGGAGLLIGAGVSAGVLVLVGAAAAVGVVLYLNRAPNPGGTDMIIDASRL